MKLRNITVSSLRSTTPPTDTLQHPSYICVIASYLVLVMTKR